MCDSMAKAREIATQFPRLRACLETAAADYGAAPDNTFEFGLQAILDHNARKPLRHDQEPVPRPPPSHSSGQDRRRSTRRPA